MYERLTFEKGRTRGGRHSCCPAQLEQFNFEMICIHKK